MNIKSKNNCIVLLVILAFILCGCSNTQNMENTVDNSIQETTETTKETIIEDVKENTVLIEEQTTEEELELSEDNDGDGEIVEEEISGKYMIIKLKTNPTTGFDFVVTLTNDSQGEVHLEEKINEDPNAGSTPRILGAAIYRTYVFSAEGCKAGSATIDFNYKRNWEGGENAFHVYYDVEVDENNNIKYIGKRAQKETIDVDINEYDDPIFTDEYEISDKSFEEEPEK